MSFNCLFLILCTVFCVVRTTESDVDMNINFRREDADDVITDLPEEPEMRRNMERPIGRIRDTHPMKFLDTLNNQARDIRLTSTANSPYMAQILIHERPWCAGAVVDVNWIVTAAHCLNYVLPVSPMKDLSNSVKARVGSVSAADGGLLVGVAGAVRHPKFEEEPVPHADVALLRLADKLEFTKYVNLIKIYEGKQEPYPQSFVAVMGWGATRGSGASFKDPPSALTSTRLKVRSQQFCADSYQLVHGFRFTKDFFCASMRKGARDACLFDAGAPAVQQNRLMGIMSFGPEQCGDDYQPAVFIKAFYFRDFVKQTIASYKTTKDLLEAMQDVEGDSMEGPDLPNDLKKRKQIKKVDPTEETVNDDDSLTTTTENDLAFR